MSKLKDYVSRLAVENELVELQEKDKIRVSVTMDDFIARRVELCAKRLGMTRAGLASEIISKAIFEVEEALGFQIKDENGEFTEYGKEVLAGYGLEKPPAYEESEVTK